MSAHIMIRVGFLFAPTMLRDTLDRGRLPLKLIFKSLCFSMPIASYRLLKQFKTCNGKCKRRAIRLSRLLKQPVVLLLVKFPEIALLADCAVGHFKQAMVRFPELALLYRLRDWTAREPDHHLFVRLFFSSMCFDLLTIFTSLLFPFSPRSFQYERRMGR